MPRALWVGVGGKALVAFASVDGRQLLLLLGVEHFEPATDVAPAQVGVTASVEQSHDERPRRR